MGQANNLEQTLETSHTETSVVKQADISRDSYPPLLLPRKRLSMTKAYSGNWEPWSWFIKDRLSKKATFLDSPTESSMEGLTSGFRSAIIRNTDGRYLKLKGVSLKPTIRFDKKIFSDGRIEVLSTKGLGTFRELFDETQVLQLVNFLNPHVTSCFPEFLEIYNSPSIHRGKKHFNQDYSRPPVRYSCTSVREKDSCLVKEELRKMKDYFSSIDGLTPFDYFVTGSEILGDTRLDEVVYHFTKKRLYGDLLKRRDEFLKYLFYKSGDMLGLLNNLGFSWSKDLIQSNSHFGNFVVMPVNNSLEVRICDLGSAKYFTQFDSQEQFIDFVRKDSDNFKYEFDTTSSLTVQRRYMEFSDSLKSACLNSFRTGYYLSILNDSRFRDEILRSYSLKKSVSLSRTDFALSEFEDLVLDIDRA